MVLLPLLLEGLRQPVSLRYHSRHLCGVSLGQSLEFHHARVGRDLELGLVVAARQISLCEEPGLGLLSGRLNRLQDREGEGQGASVSGDWGPYPLDWLRTHLQLLSQGLDLSLEAVHERGVGLSVQLRARREESGLGVLELLLSLLERALRLGKVLSED